MLTNHNSFYDAHGVSHSKSGQEMVASEWEFLAFTKMLGILSNEKLLMAESCALLIFGSFSRFFFEKNAYLKKIISPKKSRRVTSGIGAFCSGDRVLQNPLCRFEFRLFFEEIRFF